MTNPVLAFPHGFFSTRELFSRPELNFRLSFTPVFILVESTAPSPSSHNFTVVETSHSYLNLICCVLIFIGLLTVFDLPAVVKLHKSFRIKRDYSFKLAAVIMHIFHLRSALPFAAICHERWVFFPGTTRRCQTTNTNDLTSGRLAVPSSLATTPQSSFLQATHRPVRDFDFFFERLIASSAASPPHYFPARLSSSCSSTSACGSSTSSTTGASHLQSVSSRRLSETPFSSTFHQSKSWLVVFMTSDRRDFSRTNYRLWL